jgi:DNA modification methylase
MVTEDITFFSNGNRRKPIESEKLDKQLFYDHFTDCWAFPGIASDAKAGHPATFPVLLPRLVMSFNTAAGEIVGEPFSGAGTTIIACEQLGRKCRAMEIDPGYVAVSIQRWADATGKTPRLLTEAEPLTKKKKR